MCIFSMRVVNLLSAVLVVALTIPYFVPIAHANRSFEHFSLFRESRSAYSPGDGAVDGFLIRSNGLYLYLKSLNAS